MIWIGQVVVLTCAATLILVGGCSSAKPPDGPSDIESAERLAAKYFDAGDRLRQQGDYAAAHEAYEKGLQASPLSPRAEEIIGKQYETGHRLLYTEGSGFLGLGRSPRSAGVKILEDIAARAAAADKEAVTEAAVRLSPVVENARWTLASHYFKEGNYAAARKHYEALVEQFPDGLWTIKATLYAAECCWRQSGGAQYDEAVLDEALRRFAEYRRKYAEIGIREDYDGAEERIRRIEDVKAEKRYLTARNYQEKGQYEAARRYCETVIRDYKESKWVEPANRLLAEVESKLVEMSKVE